MAIPSKLGTLNSLSFAMFTSIRATTIAIKISFMIKTSVAKKGFNPSPKGKNREANKEENIIYFMDAAISIRAR